MLKHPSSLTYRQMFFVGGIRIIDDASQLTLPAPIGLQNFRYPNSMSFSKLDVCVLLLADCNSVRKEGTLPAR